MTELSTEHRPAGVLVTGGAGFIGANFLLRMVPLYPNVHFVNLDALTYAGNLMNLREVQHSGNYTFVHGSITDPALVRSLFAQYHFTSVVHFAAESHVDRSIRSPLGFVQTNINGTVALLEEARAAWRSAMSSPNQVRFVHVSTDEVFGSLGHEGVFRPDTPYAPRSPYSASKAAADHFVRAYANTYGLPAVISNCSNNYGPFQFPEKLIPLTILRALNRQQVPVYGTGANIRDWLHVHDHCAALDLILHKGRIGDTYLIGGASELTNLALVRMLLTLVDEALDQPEGTSLDLITFVADRPGHDFRYAVDASRIRRELAWHPSYSIERGLRATIAWYLSNRDWLDAVADQSYRNYLNEQYSL
ncbi:MAG: dTDP-glucose 4,6-dehydratase [Bacteroidota bacterium]|nr:dTDP-glucose 4,6-dehydratase [Bacteroidota bacterium]